ncbi:hypothetical protein ACOMHN_012571 [Nucella lapillus]
MVGALLTLAASASSPHPSQRETSFDRRLPNDVLFTEDVLMEVSARSRIECSKKCAGTEGCVMCTFHSSPQGPPGHCRLHSQLQTAADGKQSMPGAKSVVRRPNCDGDRGYVLACDTCLNLVNIWVNYTTATEACSELQGRLAMVTSPEHLDCIWTYTNSTGLARAWVGADDKQKAGTFWWTDGTVLPDNSPLWTTRELEPDKAASGNDSVYIFSDCPGLYDRPCWMSHQYLCQNRGL